MHVSGKKMAFAGLGLALTVLAIVLSGILEFNTLFLLGAASCFIGIVIEESNLKMGFAFYIAAILLGLILAPNKLYCITFAAMGFYVLGIESAYIRLGNYTGKWNRKVCFWIVKVVIFNLMFLPMLFAFPRLLFERNIQGWWLFAAVAAGQIVLVIYDRAYEYFMGHLWKTFRKRVRFDH